jgi:hypothetical protein
MGAFLAQVTAAARKAPKWGYCKQGKPQNQQKNTNAGHPRKKRSAQAAFVVRTRKNQSAQQQRRT